MTSALILAYLGVVLMVGVAGIASAVVPQFAARPQWVQ